MPGEGGESIRNTVADGEPMAYTARRRWVGERPQGCSAKKRGAGKNRNVGMSRAPNGRGSMDPPWHGAPEARPVWGRMPPRPGRPNRKRPKPGSAELLVCARRFRWAEFRLRPAAMRRRRRRRPPPPPPRSLSDSWETRHSTEGRMNVRPASRRHRVVGQRATNQPWSDRYRGRS